MRIKVLEDVLSTKDRDTGRHYDLVRDDTITVPDALGERWCGLGWVEDVDGNVETGERIVRGARVEPQSARHAGQAKEV